MEALNDGRVRSALCVRTSLLNKRLVAMKGSGKTRVLGGRALSVGLVSREEQSLLPQRQSKGRWCRREGLAARSLESIVD